MSIEFSTLQSLTIPEGVVTQITDAAGRVIWAVQNNEPVVLQVEKITSDTYAGETTYTGEEFILLDIYPKTANSTVDVTYGGLTKTLTFSGTNAQQVFFGTFNGVSDSVTTPASGELVIEGDIDSFAVGSYKTYNSTTSKTSTNYCCCITSVMGTGSASRIRASAFANCTGLTSVHISKSVTSIDMTAFSGCNNIANFSVDSGNKNYYSDNYALFNKSKTELIKCMTTPPSQYVVPSSVISIGESAFNSRSNLTNITLPDGLTSIGASAFGSCTSLTSITIPDSVTSIGASAFGGCIIEATLLGQPESIGSGAFSDPANLNRNFETSVYFNVADWDWDKWAQMGNPPYSCEGSHSGAYIVSVRVYINGVLTRNITGDIVLSDCTKISDNTFYNFGITSITIPDSVTSIGASAFGGCSLTSITIPDSVTSISEYLFAQCRSLTSITIPDSVTSIGERAFYECRSLTSITIPDSVTSIDTYVFGECAVLISAVFENTSGWYVTKTKNGDISTGTAVDVSDPANNVTLIKSTYSNYYWYRS